MCYSLTYLSTFLFLKNDENEDLDRPTSLNSNFDRRNITSLPPIRSLKAMFTNVKRSFFTYALLVRGAFRLHNCHHTRVYQTIYQ